MRLIPVLAATALAAVVAPCAWADLVTLKPVADTVLFELNPGNNLGGTTSLPVGTVNKGKRGRLLLRFDLAATIPSNAIIAAATLTLTVQASGGVDSGFRLHRLLQAWGEGAKTGNTGGTAGAGEATWDARFAPDLAWSAPGAAAPTDFSGVVSSAQLLSGPGVYSFAASTNLLGDLQLWLRDSATNHGWVMISENEDVASTSKRVASREDPVNTPTLRIEFTVPEPAPRIDGIARQGDEIQLSLSLAAGKLYAVEYKDQLDLATWSLLTQVASKFFPTNVVVSDSRLASPQRFYRVGIVGDVD